MWTTSNASAINAHFAPNSLLPFFAFFFFFDVSNTRSPFLSALSGCTRTETRRPTSEFGNTHYACLYTHAKHTHTL